MYYKQLKIEKNTHQPSVIDSMGVRMCACNTGSLVYIYRILCITGSSKIEHAMGAPAASSSVSLSPNKGKVGLDMLPEFAVRETAQRGR